MYNKNLRKMPFILAYTLLLMSIVGTRAQAFEGKITFVRETEYETSYFTYFVKDHKIRIDEMDKSKKLVRYMIINTQDNQAFIINPGQKIYIPYSTIQQNNLPEDDFEIIKSENTKKIQNYVCTQWRVRNKTLNTEVTYWVAQDNFYFFENLLKVLRKSDNCSAYFLKIPGIKGFLPMEYVDRSLLRVKRVSFLAISLENKHLKDNIFRIPENYTSFMQSN
jgi:hypothetical protein